MDRHTLARLVADRVDGLSVRMASAAVEATCDTIAEALARNESVTLSNFGTFKTRQRNSRQTQHPRTREPIEIPAALVPAFVPSRQLQQQVKDNQEESSHASD